MSPPRIIGAVPLVVGVLLLIFGLNASHSMADRMPDFREAHLWAAEAAK